LNWDISIDSFYYSSDDAAQGNSIHDAAESNTSATRVQDKEEQKQLLISQIKYSKLNSFVHYGQSNTIPQLASDHLNNDFTPIQVHYLKWIHIKIPPGVNIAFFSGPYDSADSTIVKDRSAFDHLAPRISGLMY